MYKHEYKYKHKYQNKKHTNKFNKAQDFTLAISRGGGFNSWVEAGGSQTGWNLRAIMR